MYHQLRKRLNNFWDGMRRLKVQKSHFWYNSPFFIVFLVFLVPKNAQELVFIFIFHLFVPWMKAYIVKWCMVKVIGCQLTTLSKFLSIPPCPHISLLLTVCKFYKLFYSIQNEAVHAPQISKKELNISLKKKMY